MHYQPIFITLRSILSNLNFWFKQKNRKFCAWVGDLDKWILFFVLFKFIFFFQMKILINVATLSYHSHTLFYVHSSFKIDYRLSLLIFRWLFTLIYVQIIVVLLKYLVYCFPQNYFLIFWATIVCLIFILFLLLYFYDYFP